MAPTTERWIDEGPARTRRPSGGGDQGRRTRGRDEPSAAALAAVEDRAGSAIRLDVGERRAGRMVAVVARGLDAFESERWRDASSILGPAARQVPSSGFIQEILGLSLYRQQRWLLAAQHLESSRRTLGTLANHAVLADCYRALRRWNLVDALWEELRLAAPDPDTVAEGRIVAASSLADRGNLPAAIALLEGAPTAPKRVSERHLRTWYVLGDLHDRAGNPVSARKFFARVVAHDSRFADARERLAMLVG
jgi:tetratricopeptide (TPR) repeat protein